MRQIAIQTDKLSYNFGNIQAVDNLSIEVPSCSIFGFLGPNGAGKTTTIHLLLGLLEPASGQATVLGFDTKTQSHDIRSQTGVLLEHTGLYERLSAEDNLEFYGRIWKLSPTERKTRIKELLTRLGLWDRRKEMAGNWSRGMKQKLAMARSLLNRPSLIFLDEPTAGMDPKAAKSLRDELVTLSNIEKVTIFLTTHNLAEAEKLCHQVGIIHKGKLIASGPPDKLLGNQSKQIEIVGHGFSQELPGLLRERPEVMNVAMADNLLQIELFENGDIAPLVSLIAGTGAAVEEVLKVNSNLEEVFLTLVEEEN